MFVSLVISSNALAEIDSDFSRARITFQHNLWISIGDVASIAERYWSGFKSE